MFLGTMYQGIGQKVGISTGISTSHTEIYHGGWYRRNPTSTLSLHPSIRVSLSNFKVSRNVLSMPIRSLVMLCVTNSSSSLTKTMPVRVFDVQTNRFVRIRLRCNYGPGDNPAQSEISGHIGGSGNFYCRKCMVGGKMKEKTTNEGYCAMLKMTRPVWES
jgi:hypothetical protein